MSARNMALEALKDIRSEYLYGVGWDRAQEKADAAITALEAELAQGPSPFAEICDYERATDDDGRTLQYALVYSLPDTEKLLPIGTALFADPQEPEVNAALLEAAQWCIALCEEIGATGTNAYAAARAAIAKAGGAV
ncbi:MAG: hypothetical protein JJD98_00340 [Polaromonas sp.]|nr:hypothetical protein [Polaromonas sp.]